MPGPDEGAAAAPMEVEEKKDAEKGEEKKAAALPEAELVGTHPSPSS